MIVFGKPFDEVYQNLQVILLCFRHYNLKLKSTKSHIFQCKVNIFGLVEVNPDNIENIDILNLLKIGQVLEVF